MRGWKSGRDGLELPLSGHHLMRSAVVMVVAALMAIAGVVGFSTAAGAAGNGIFSIQPVSSTAQHPRGYFTPVLTPGVVAHDQVVVVNESDKALTLDLYAAQALNTKSGGFALQPNFKPKKDMGAWIHLPYPTITIPAHSGDVVPFTYDPPAHVAPGDYAGGIVAEETHGTVTKAGAVRIQALLAVGTAVYGRVLGPLHARLAVTSVSVETTSPFVSNFAGPLDATVSYTITNTGNENLTPLASISLSPFIGNGPRARLTLPQMLPGSTVTFTHTFDGVNPLGHLTVAVAVKALSASGSGTAGTTVIPWGIVGIVVLAVLVMLLLWRRRHHRSPPVSHPEGAEPDSGGTEASAPVETGAGVRSP